MSLIFGTINFNGTEADRDAFERMRLATDYWGPDRTDVYMQSEVCLGQHMLFNTPESRTEKLPFHSKSSQHILVCDARIDNRQDLIKSIDDTDKTDSDSQLILKAYLKWGKTCLDFLKGDFAFVIYNIESKEIFCARDHMGIRPLFYDFRDSVLVFSSDLKGILASRVFPYTVNERRQLMVIFNEVIMNEPDETIYNEIKQLPPAHGMTVTRQGTSIFRYWKLDPSKRAIKMTQDDYISAFREKFQKSVEARLRSSYRIGSELTGGIDSSGIVAHAFNKLSGDISTFSMVKPDDQFDEFGIIDEVSQQKMVCDHLGHQRHHMISRSNRGILEDIDRAVNQQSRPVNEAPNLFNYSMWDIAKKEGCRTMLSGLGGDHMVSSLTDGRYHEYWSEFCLSGIFGDLLHTPFNLQKKEWIKLLGGLFKAMNLALHPKITSYFNRRGYYSWHSTIVNDKGLIALNIPEIPLINISKQNYRERQIDHLNNNLLYSRITYNAVAGLDAQIEHRYPLLDIDLMEYYLSLPASLKSSVTLNRFIYRLAIQHTLPDEIAMRMDKYGTTIPHYYHNFFHDNDQITEVITSSLGDYMVKKYFNLKELEIIVRDLSDSNTKKLIPRVHEIFNLLVLLKFNNLI